MNRGCRPAASSSRWTCAASRRCRSGWRASRGSHRTMTTPARLRPCSRRRSSSSAPARPSASTAPVRSSDASRYLARPSASPATPSFHQASVRPEEHSVLVEDGDLPVGHRQSLHGERPRRPRLERRLPPTVCERDDVAGAFDARAPAGCPDRLQQLRSRHVTPVQCRIRDRQSVARREPSSAVDDGARSVRHADRSHQHDLCLFQSTHCDPRVAPSPRRRFCSGEGRRPPTAEGPRPSVGPRSVNVAEDQVTLVRSHRGEHLGPPPDVGVQLPALDEPAAPQRLPRPVAQTTLDLLIAPPQRHGVLVCRHQRERGFRDRHGGSVSVGDRTTRVAAGFLWTMGHADAVVDD